VKLVSTVIVVEDEDECDLEGC